MYHISADLTIGNFQKAHGKGPAMAHLPRRTGIKEKDPIDPFVEGMMGMAENDHIRPDLPQPIGQRLGRMPRGPDAGSHQDP